MDKLHEGMSNKRRLILSDSIQLVIDSVYTKFKTEAS